MKELKTTCDSCGADLTFHEENLCQGYFILMYYCNFSGLSIDMMSKFCDLNCTINWLNKRIHEIRTYQQSTLIDQASAVAGLDSATAEPAASHLEENS